MKALTNNEILFIKDSGWTPTIYQCDEWYKIGIDAEDFFKELERYNIDGHSFLDKFFGEDEIDNMSFEDEAAYILSLFFNWGELLKMLKEDSVLEWLRNWKYYYGARKWTKEEANDAVAVAMDLLSNNKKIKVDEHGSIMILEN